MNIGAEDYIAQLGESDRQQPAVAFFDLDRTLIDGYSLTALAWQQISDQGISVRRFVSLSLMFASYALGRRNYDEMLQATVNDIIGMSEVELEQLGKQAFAQRLARAVYAEGKALVAAHRAINHEVVMVTSATRYQAAPVAKALNIDHLCCTELDLLDGRVAGGVQTCYGEGKHHAAAAFAQARGIDLQACYFYSDSAEDLPLLESVGYHVVVNGRSELVKHGHARGWPSMVFKQKAA